MVNGEILHISKAKKVNKIKCLFIVTWMTYRNVIFNAY